MLDTFLPRKESGTNPSPSPMMSQASPSSESNGSMDVVSLFPLTTHDDGSLHSQSRLPERSLRQRGTSSSATTTPSQTSPPGSITNPRADEDDSLSNSEDDEPKGGSGNNGTPSILRSVLGASPFLMGPHIFSTSEILQPPTTRARKESDDLRTNLDRSPPSKQNSVYRRGAPVPPLMAASSSLGSPYTDGDIEGGEFSLDDSIVSSSSVGRRQRRNSYQKNYAFVLRSRENTIIHFLMETRMLRTELPLILFATFMQFFHSTVTNFAYWQHAQLNAANRVPLKDIAFEMLPALDGDMWIISEYILWVILGTVISCMSANLVVKWNAPHGRPIYTVQILRRMCITLVCCQVLRMISFLVTTLPGASRQCRYTVPDGLTSAEMLNGPAPNEGNPSGYAPPTNLYDILFRFDCTNGCGDLMFSSHTIFTMTFVCIVFKYFDFKFLKFIMALAQIAIVPFILAARKHYSVDVFTALYLTPLMFEILWTRRPDRDTSIDLAKYYGIRFYLAQESHDSFSYVVSVWGREFSVDRDELPIDISQGRYHVKGLALPWGKGGERTTASIV